MRIPLAGHFRVNRLADAHYYARWYRFRLDPAFAMAGTWMLRVPVTTDIAELYRSSATGIRIARFGFRTPVMERTDRDGDAVVTLQP